MPRQTLRQLLGSQGITEDDWTRANSMEGGGNLADRQKIYDTLLRTTGGTGYGSRGAFNYFSNPAAGGGGDNGGGGPSEGFGTGADQFFSPNAFGDRYSPVQYGTVNGFLSDRGNYNYSIPDLGNIEWDPEYGMVNNQDVTPGSRVNRSFDNFYNLTNGVIGTIAGAGIANGLGVQGIPGFDQAGAGWGGGYAPLGADPLTFTSGGTIGPFNPSATTGLFGGSGGAGLLGNGGSALGGASELASVGETGGSLLGGAAPQSVSVNGTGLFSNLPSWAQSGMNNAFSNPMNALRLGQGLAGIVGGIRGGGNNQPSTQGGKSGSAGTAQMGNVQRPEYTPNPYTQQQLNDYRRFG